ncbi:F-box/FBD/LRR-repeat protein-like protein, partial [Tanacetum coccineum]
RRRGHVSIPKLVFIEDKFQVSTDGADLSVSEQTFYTLGERIRMFKRRKLFYAINQVLSMHEGPIHEFTLSMELTDLCLEGCYVSPPPTINGFGSLTRLSLQNIYIYDEPLRHLLSNCRFLKSVALGIDAYHVHKSGNEDSNIINLFECLPVVETLSISFSIIQLFESSVHGRIPRELPTALIHLKYLTLNGVSFRHKDVLSVLVLVIKSSPNLEKLKVGVVTQLDFFTEGGLFTDDDICSFSLKDYADIWLEHLNELHIGSFKNQGNELNFVKLILAKSPVLKKVRIYHKLTSNELMQISKVLLSFPRASSVVDFNV